MDEFSFKFRKPKRQVVPKRNPGDHLFPFLCVFSPHFLCGFLHFQMNEQFLFQLIQTAILIINLNIH